MKEETLASPKDAALKLALEALWTTANPKAEEAITAIKEALAQDEASSSRAAQEPDLSNKIVQLREEIEDLKYKLWEWEDKSKPMQGE
jgi:hypothetical protein